VIVTASRDQSHGVLFAPAVITTRELACRCFHFVLTFYPKAPGREIEERSNSTTRSSLKSHGTLGNKNPTIRQIGKAGRPSSL
jgi:hypothetical protein